VIASTVLCLFCCVSLYIKHVSSFSHVLHQLSQLFYIPIQEMLLIQRLLTGFLLWCFSLFVLFLITRDVCSCLRFLYFTENAPPPRAPSLHEHFASVLGVLSRARCSWFVRGSSAAATIYCYYIAFLKTLLRNIQYQHTLLPVNNVFGRLQKPL
jgi:hypothetical protein